MVKKSKTTGKTRLDKFYHLAKEQGFRSRAAFKLIQLDQKFGFLNATKVLLDLCAAPGGWMQVAVTRMPVASLVLGVDLVPIKTIRGAKSFVGDITSPECYARIKTELQHFKADTILHDGAPNLGASWERDAYLQNELVLSALKLATQFLRPGGLFLTKVFRSSDYNSLMYIFSKLFASVTATKPIASRATSAEIFVVCRGYQAPSSIDPKLLNPKYVFMETKDLGDKEVIRSLRQLVPSKIPRSRGGYDEALGPLLSRTATLADFLDCQNPFQFLADHGKLTREDEKSKELLEVEKPPKYFAEYCEDLKVCGRAELALLLKWRNKAKRKTAPQTDTVAEIQEEPDSDQELDDLIKRSARDDKRKVKKERILEKKQAKSVHDSDPFLQDQELFTTQDPYVKAHMREIVDQPELPEEEEVVEAGSEDEEQLEYEDEGDRLLHLEELLEEEEAEDMPRKRSKLAPQMTEEAKAEEAARWFQKDIFEGVEEINTRTEKQKKKDKRQKKEQRKPKQETTDFEVVPQAYPEERDEEALAETIALGKAMLRKKRAREIESSTYNRYVFDDDGALPSWFVDDQKQFYTAPLPLSYEEMQEARAEVTKHTKRPIHKVAEAIARRKRKLTYKLDKLKTKADHIIGQADVSEGSKLQQVQKLYKKEIHNNAPKKRYVVANGNWDTRMRSRKTGRNVRFVDRRLKKDKRAARTKARHHR